MKQILIQLVVVLLLIGCNERKSSKNDKLTTFDLIDLSVKQETGVYSLKISGLGKTYICFDDLRKHSIYYTFNVGEKEIDSINYLIRQIKLIKTDTLYTAKCEDCSSYRIVIKSKDLIIIRYELQSSHCALYKVSIFICFICLTRLFILSISFFPTLNV